MRYIVVFMLASLVIVLVAWWMVIEKIHHSFDNFSLPT